MAKKIPKTTTEPVISSLGDIWNDFENEYKPFVEWFYDKESEHKFCNIEFIQNTPEKYVNKWNRTQWKILVKNDYDEEAILSGGKRLFQTILNYCKKVGKEPTNLGQIILYRIGNGFDTRYKIE